MPRPARRSEPRADRRAERGRTRRAGHVAGAHDVQPVGARRTLARRHGYACPAGTSTAWSTSPDGPNAQDEQAHHGDGLADAACELSLKLADALERIADDHAWPRRISLNGLSTRVPRTSSATSPRPWGVGVAGVDDAVGIQQPVAGLELFVPDLEPGRGALHVRAGREDPVLTGVAYGRLHDPGRASADGGASQATNGEVTNEYLSPPHGG